MKKGFVALVGAGPGDPGLLTLRGRELLTNAEVVVYDRLVSDEIMSLIPENARLIDVGKQSSSHTVKQPDINKILLDEAQGGRRVVRLKGGDPFLFGRGGEELELLFQNGIPFEVVPGVTSAIAAPSFAGIPVTHRDFCSSVHIITGHQRENEPLKINFPALAKTGGTLVFLMGVASLPRISAGLIAAGMDEGAKAAVIENGTRLGQRKIVSNLGKIAELAKERGIQSPAVIVVGEVCGLADRFDWFTKRPLSGRTIIVTRPKSSGGRLQNKLSELGARVVSCPAATIARNENMEPLRAAIKNIARFSWLLFTSKNAVDILFDELYNMGLDSRALGGVKVGAVGNETAAGLRGYGIIADYIPKTFYGRALGEGIKKLTDGGDKILLLRAKNGGGEILEALSGRDCTNIHIYETVYESALNEQVINELKTGEQVLVTFTSAGTVLGFMAAASGSNINNVLGVCIGEITAAEAEKCGIRHVVSEEATIDSMVDRILEESGCSL